MNEYRVIKCSACGQDRKGARIIRIASGHHKKLYQELEAREKLRSWYCATGLVVSLIIIEAMWWIILGNPINVLANANEIPWTLIAMLFTLFGLILFWKFMETRLQLIKKFLKEHYQLKEKEDYEIITE